MRLTVVVGSAACLIALAAVALFVVTTSETGGVAPAPHLSSPALPPHSTSAPWWNTQTSAELYGTGVWVNPSSQPAVELKSLRASGHTAEATAIATIASQPIAVWLSDSWTNSELVQRLTTDVAAAEAAHRTPVFVSYAIPDRDCGGYSAGGYSDTHYRLWSDLIAKTLSGHHAVLLMEPDSLAMLGKPQCSTIVGDRLALVNTVTRHFAESGVAVYLDAGNSNWQSASVMAGRLSNAGIVWARGFFTNVSNFKSQSAELKYATELSGMLGGKHFVIDVSRNGNGAQPSWCNPPGAALGPNPVIADGKTALDALLWVKTPGSSDGSCNGDPSAGHWFEKYALLLVAHRHTTVATLP